MALSAFDLWLLPASERLLLPGHGCCLHSTVSFPFLNPHVLRMDRFDNKLSHLPAKINAWNRVIFCRVVVCVNSHVRQNEFLRENFRGQYTLFPLLLLAVALLAPQTRSDHASVNCRILSPDCLPGLPCPPPRGLPRLPGFVRRSRSAGKPIFGQAADLSKTF